MIKLEQISFSYDDNRIVLDNICYQFNAGGKYTIVGKNGEGKTTLIKLILGLLKPSSGNITLCNQIKFSYLPDNNGLYEDLTVLDNIIFRLALYGEKFKHKESIIVYYLKKYNILDKKKKLVKTLSLGTKKKVALICTLIVNADVYILDEPSGGIDAESKNEIINMINDMAIDNIVICISHDESIINGFHSTKIEIKEGKIYD